MAKTENLHKGHRQNVRERYLATGLRGMADHNVLEFLLFFGIPQKDTNELAHRLLQRFGSFADVLRADVSELKAISGMTENAACLLNLILPVYQRYCISMSVERPLLDSTETLEAFIRPYYVDTMKERVVMLCLDDEKRLLSVHRLGDGSIAEVFLDMRALASIILDSKAKFIVLVHNHPNGIAQPSPSDVELTRRVIEFLNMLKVSLMDHLILTDKAVFSFAKSRRFCYMFYGLDPEDALPESE